MNPKDPDDLENLMRLVKTRPELRTTIEHQMVYLFKIHSSKQPCPICNQLVSYYEAADDTVTVGDVYKGKLICPHCKTELEEIVPVQMMAAIPWIWQKKH